MEKFQNKYRIPSARAAWWDYSADGCYFITICTADRECLFGHIMDDVVQLSSIGDIVNEELKQSFDIRNELCCDAYVIMPNHLHILLWIKRDETNEQEGIVRGGHLPQSISSFVAGFKSAVTKRVKQCDHSLGSSIWQSRFHDHVVRNEATYQRVFNYIHENPAKWIDDTFYM